MSYIKTSEFNTYHPVVNFVYFVFVIGFSCFFMHPVCLAVSLFCAFTYSVMLQGKKAVKTNLIYMLPMIIFMALLNPLFNHNGVTILFYLPSSNPLTAESVIYGIASAVMIVSVICHFSVYNIILTSDKFLYLFSKIIPSLSLIISTTFRFIPQFIKQLKTVANAQKCMGRDMKSGSIIKRAKNGLNILSVMTTWALENSIETADSMKARGYGIPKRTSFSIFKFDKRDLIALILICILGIYTFCGSLMGQLKFSYFPEIKGAEINIFSISVFLSYFILCMFPVIIELWEVRKWKSLKSKI